MSPEPVLPSYKSWEANSIPRMFPRSQEDFRTLHPKSGHAQREAKVRGKTQKEESDVPRSFENPRAKAVIKISSLKQSARKRTGCDLCKQKNKNN